MKNVLKFAALVLTLATISAMVLVAQSPNGIRGAFGGDLYLPRPFVFYFGHGLAGDVALSKGGINLLQHSANTHVGYTTANGDVAGVCTLGTSCAITFTNAYVAAPACQGTDQTAIAAVKAAPTTTGVTFTGTGTDVIAYHCDANPN